MNVDVVTFSGRRFMEGVLNGSEVKLGLSGRRSVHVFVGCFVLLTSRGGGK